MNMSKERAPRNRTITVSGQEKAELLKNISRITGQLSPDGIRDRIFNADLLDVAGCFPEQSADLIIIDPPYNIDKDFSGLRFSRIKDDKYMAYLESWFPAVTCLLKKNGSLYICGDWRSTSALYEIAGRYLTVRNRITWQREKGRGAKTNWKNCSEDIWFATASDDYYFNTDVVKMRRKVLAPYREDGRPKDWEETEDGRYRLTHPSNFWDDITVPYWSMPENTDHPAQKPEKLYAKLILASSREGSLVFDPFAGSGTAAVVAKKLGRHYCGVEISEDYCCIAEKRLRQAEQNRSIQGYCEGVFWERNALPSGKSKSNVKNT